KTLTRSVCLLGFVQVAQCGPIPRSSRRASTCSSQNFPLRSRTIPKKGPSLSGRKRELHLETVYGGLPERLPGPGPDSAPDPQKDTSPSPADHCLLAPG